MKIRHVEGGQGRSSQHVRQDADAVLWIALAALALAALLLIKELTNGS